MRYIGNKTKLLGFIDGVMETVGIHSGTFCDIFAGTASVARYMKSKGFQVICGDIMRYSYILQWAYVVVNQYPRFAGLPPEVGVMGHAGSGNPQGPLRKVISFRTGRWGGWLYLSQLLSGRQPRWAALFH